MKHCSAKYYRVRLSLTHNHHYGREGKGEAEGGASGWDSKWKEALPLPSDVMEPRSLQAGGRGMGEGISSAYVTLGLLYVCACIFVSTSHLEEGKLGLATGQHCAAVAMMSGGGNVKGLARLVQVRLIISYIMKSWPLLVLIYQYIYIMFFSSPWGW